MESVFADTIDRLSARVMQLEESKGVGGQGMMASGSMGGLPAVPARGAARGNHPRMEPGRIRPSGYDSQLGSQRGSNAPVARGRF
jgi:hypothetical protein